MKFTSAELEDRAKSEEGGRVLSSETTSKKITPNGVPVKEGNTGENATQTTDNMTAVNGATSGTSAAKTAPINGGSQREPEENTCSDSDDDNQVGDADGQDVAASTTQPLTAAETDKLSNALNDCHIAGEKPKSAGELEITAELSKLRLAQESEDPTPSHPGCIQIIPDKILSEAEAKEKEAADGDDKGIAARGPSGGRPSNFSQDRQYNHIASKAFPAVTAGIGQLFSPQPYQGYPACGYLQNSYGTGTVNAVYAGQMGGQTQGCKAKRGLEEGDYQPGKFYRPPETNNLDKPQPSTPEEAKVVNVNNLTGGKVSIRNDDASMNMGGDLYLDRQFSNSDAVDILTMLSGDTVSDHLQNNAFNYPPSSFSRGQTHCPMQQSQGMMGGSGYDYGDFSPESAQSEGQDMGYASDSQGSPLSALSPPPSNMSCDSGISGSSRSPQDGETLGFSQGNSSPPHSSTAKSPAHSYMSASPALSAMSASPAHSVMAASPAGSYSNQGSPAMAAGSPRVQHVPSPGSCRTLVASSPQTQGLSGSYPIAASPAVYSSPNTVGSVGFSTPQCTSAYSTPPAPVPSTIQNLLREPNPTPLPCPASATLPCPTPTNPAPLPRTTSGKPAPRPVEEREPVECRNAYVDQHIDRLIDVLDAISHDLQEQPASKSAPLEVPVCPPNPPQVPQQPPPQQAVPLAKVPIQPMSKISSPPTTAQSVVVFPPQSQQGVSVGQRIPAVPTTTSTPVLLIPGNTLPTSIVVVNAAPQPHPEKPKYRPIQPKLPDTPATSKSNPTLNGKLGHPADAKPVVPKNGLGGKPATVTSADLGNGQPGCGTRSQPASTAPSSASPDQRQQYMLNVARRLVASMTRDDLKYKDSDGDTYLHVAVCKADLNMVQALLERLDREDLREMIDVQNSMRQTPLYLAVSAGQAGMVSLFIRHGADVNLFAERVHADTRNREIKSAIHAACSNGEAWLSTLQALIASPDINLNLNNSDGHTALHCAILQHQKYRPDRTQINSIPIIRTLVQAGADLNAQDKKSGKTPMMYALETRDVQMIESFASLVDAKRMPLLMRTQAFDGCTAFKIAESVRQDFAPASWQKLWALLRQ